MGPTFLYLLLVRAPPTRILESSNMEQVMINKLALVVNFFIFVQILALLAMFSTSLISYIDPNWAVPTAGFS